MKLTRSCQWNESLERVFDKGRHLRFTYRSAKVNLCGAVLCRLVIVYHPRLIIAEMSAKDIIENTAWQCLKIVASR